MPSPRFFYRMGGGGVDRATDYVSIDGIDDGEELSVQQATVILLMRIEERLQMIERNTAPAKPLR